MARDPASSLPDHVASAEVIVELIDANDNSPIFSPEAFMFSVQENTPPPFIVGSVMATDRDSGDNAMVCQTQHSRSSKSVG